MTQLLYRCFCIGVICSVANGECFLAQRLQRAVSCIGFVVFAEKRRRTFVVNCSIYEVAKNELRSEL